MARLGNLVVVRLRGRICCVRTLLLLGDGWVPALRRRWLLLLLWDLRGNICRVKIVGRVVGWGVVFGIVGVLELGDTRRLKARVRLVTRPRARPVGRWKAGVRCIHFWGWVCAIAIRL